MNDALKTPNNCKKPQKLVIYKKSEWCIPNKNAYLSTKLHENPKGDVMKTVFQNGISKFTVACKGIRVQCLL